MRERREARRRRARAAGNPDDAAERVGPLRGSGYDTPAYWVDALGEVHLKGSVAQSGAANDVIFIMPVGLRPAQSMNWPATLDSATFGTIEIETDGRVRSRTFNGGQAAASRLFTSMEGVSYRPTDP